MYRFRNAALVLAMVFVASTAFAQLRGDGRITGKVVDDQGQPAPGVQIKAMKPGETQVLETKTNNRGDWAFNGLAGGQWNLEFTKDGFEPQRVSVEIDEESRGPLVEVKLSKPPVDPNVELQAEIQRAAPLLEGGQFAQARTIYEGLLAKYPTVHQLHRFIASTYAGEQNYKMAAEHLKIALKNDPDDVELKLMTGDLMLETGEKAEGIELLKSVDMAQVKDPTALINAAIILINDKSTDQAFEILDRIERQFPARADVHYYRGRAYIVVDKLPEAKASLEKFVSMAEPTSRELPDAKKILEQLKDVK